MLLIHFDWLCWTFPVCYVPFAILILLLGWEKNGTSKHGQLRVEIKKQHVTSSTMGTTSPNLAGSRWRQDTISGKSGGSCNLKKTDGINEELEATAETTGDSCASSASKMRRMENLNLEGTNKNPSSKYQQLPWYLGSFLFTKTTGKFWLFQSWVPETFKVDSVATTGNSESLEKKLRKVSLHDPGVSQWIPCSIFWNFMESSVFVFFFLVNLLLLGTRGKMSQKRPKVPFPLSISCSGLLFRNVCGFVIISWWALGSLGVLQYTEQCCLRRTTGQPPSYVQFILSLGGILYGHLGYHYQWYGQPTSFFKHPQKTSDWTLQLMLWKMNILSTMGSVGVHVKVFSGVLCPK